MTLRNPEDFPIDQTKQFFQLRSAVTSLVQGQLTSRGHPGHAPDFKLALNENPLMPTWSSLAGFEFNTGLPGLNRLEFRHDWYASETLDFTTVESEMRSIIDVSPEYQGRYFDIGSTSPRFVGHAGGSSLVGVNNLAACLDARVQGLWHLEIDVSISGDGVPFLYHDWVKLKRLTGLDYGASASSLAATGIITFLEEALANFDWLILDLTHNSYEDVVRIVDYMNQNHPDRFRRDVYLQVYQRPDYDYIRNLDPALKLSFNLASWSAWGVTNNWKNHLADIVAQTDFYVINPSSAVDADMINFLNSNGLNNRFVPVMHTHSPEEVMRLYNLAPFQTSPMINTPDLLPDSWPPRTNCPPSHPMFRFTFDGIDPYENTGDAIEIAFAPSANISRTADADGTPDRAVLTQSSPPTSLALTPGGIARLNAEAAHDFTITISAKAARFNAPQIIAMGMQSANPRYVSGFYLLDENAYFILTHTNNTQTWVLAGNMGDRVWHQLTVTSGDGQITTYQDGLLVAAARPPLPFTRPQIDSFEVATDPLIPSRTFDGRLDDLAYYPYLLSQDEIWSMVQNGAGICAPFALAEWLIEKPQEPSLSIFDSSRRSSLPLIVRPETLWDDDRVGTADSSLRTVPGVSTGAYLSSEGIDTLNGLLGSNWTISGWINVQQTTGTQFLFGGQNRNRTFRYQLGLTATDGDALFFVRPLEGDQVVVNLGRLTADTWQHLAVTHNGTILKTFLDGEQVSGVSVGTSLRTLDRFTDFSIGFDPVDPTRTANGRFDEIRIHPFALTSDEINGAAAALPADGLPQKIIVASQRHPDQ